MMVEQNKAGADAIKFQTYKAVNLHPLLLLVG